MHGPKLQPQRRLDLLQLSTPPLAYTNGTDRLIRQEHTYLGRPREA